jgi:phosphate transport system substrate-binding protein
MQITKRSLALAMTGLVVLSACGSSGSPPSAAAPASVAAPGSVVAPASEAAGQCTPGSITAAGSTALQPLVDAGQKQYARGCTGATISVQGGGSGTGLTQVLQGAVQIGDSDIFAEEKLQPADAAQLVDHQVAREGFVMIAHAGVTGVTGLTTQQAADIWTGKTTNWKDVGGPDLPVVLILRPASSGTRATFKRIVLGGTDEAAGQALTEDSNGAVTTAVQQTPGGTSYVGFSYYQTNKAGLVALQLDGVEATVDNMASDSYKLQTIGHMYTKGAGDPLSQAFIAYLLTSDVQNGLLKSLFYAPVGATLVKPPVQGAPPAAPATSASPAASAAPATPAAPGSASY